MPPANNWSRALLDWQYYSHKISEKIILDSADKLGTDREVQHNTLFQRRWKRDQGEALPLDSLPTVK
jgi:hypothetical protein